MWIFFVIAPLALIAAVIVNRLATAKHDAIERELEREEMAILERTGQRIEGRARGSYVIDGVVGGAAIKLDSLCWSKPPNDPDDDHGRNLTMVTVRADLPDFVVCRSDDAAHVFAGAPAAPTTTGSVRFDKRFVGTEDPARAAAYRAAAGGPRVWSSPTLAERLVDLDLQWIEVAGGTVKLAFAPVSTTQVERALAAGASVARIASGGTELPIPAGPIAAADRPTIRGGGESALWVALGVTLFAGPIALVLGFLPPMREGMSDICCGPNDSIVITSEADDDGTSFGMECRDHPDASTLPLHLLSLSIWATFVFGAATAFGLRGWPRRSS